MMWRGGFSLRVGTLAVLPTSNLFRKHNNRELREHMLPVSPNMSTVGRQPLLVAASAAGAVSFWVTTALAAAGSVLSALCITDPISHPKDQPSAFLGQWFIWLATGLLWATVAASLACSWLKPADLAGVGMAFAISRWASRAICDREWKTRHARTPGFCLPANPCHMSR